MMISIITPCFNASKFISNTITSIKNQTYNDWELIIVDDCSTDGSIEIIESFTASDKRIKLIKNHINKGVAETRNTALKEAKGKYIAFLDSDDQWDSNKLEKQFTFMEENNISFSFTNYRIVDENNNVILKRLKLDKKISYKNLLRGNQIGCLTVMINITVLGKRKFLKIGHEDYALWLDYLRIDNIAYCLDEPLASYRKHSGSISHNKFRAASFTWNIYRKIEKISLLKSTFLFSHYAYKSLIKSFLTK